jgi:hypothetical protein
LYYERNPTPGNGCAGGSVPTGKGKTRKDARDDLVKKLRGVVLKTGVDFDYKAAVPEELQ